MGFKDEDIESVIERRQNCLPRIDAASADPGTTSPWRATVSPLTSPLLKRPMIDLMTEESRLGYMRAGRKVLLVHAISKWQEALEVTWVAGNRWRARRIPESKLGADYITLQVKN